MNRHQRRAAVSGMPKTGGEKPRIGTPERPGNVAPFPVLPCLAAVLMATGQEVHISAELFARLQAEKVIIDSAPDGNGGFRLRARATAKPAETPSGIVIAKQMPSALEAGRPGAQTLLQRISRTG